MKTKLLLGASWVTFLVSAVSEWGLNIDLPLTPAVWLAIAISTLMIAIGPVARAALTTNNWNVGSGKWEIGSNWTAGEPSPADAIDFVTGGIPVGPRVITVDQAAVSSNVINGCLTISNLTVGGTSTAPNTLFLNTDASNTPGNMGLSVGNALTILSHGTLSITNSYLYVSGQGIFDDSFIVLNTGTLITSAGTVSVGYNGPGQMTVQDGTWQAGRVVVGKNPGSQGTLTISGGTVSSPGNGVHVGNLPDSAGTLWLTGGQLSENSTVIGGSGVGQMVVSNGTWQCVSGLIQAQGTLVIAGGVSTISLDSGFTPGTGVVWMTGGQLLSYSNSIYLGDAGPVQMTVSNGLWQCGGVILGDDETSESIPGTGTLTIAGGTNTFSALYLGAETNCLGTIWLTGGSLTVTNYATHIGDTGGGRVTVSNGTWLANEIDLGASMGAFGTLTVAGGQILATSGVGRIMVGGTELDVFSDFVGSGRGRMFVGGGSVVTRVLDIGDEDSLRSDVEIGGSGVLTVLSTMTVGDCISNGLGTVVMTGGTLYVTNATHDAVLEVRNGFFLLDGGTLVVDKLVITNTCYGVFDRSGGSLSIGTLVIDPNGDADGDGLPNSWEQQHGLDPLSTFLDNGADGDPDGDGYSNWEEYLAGSDPRNSSSTPLQITPPPFQITSILQSGNNILLTWTTPGGTTNQVQVTPGASGSYATNGFSDLGPQILIGGSGAITTNYTDFGGATNTPSRFYRVRLVP